MMDASFFSREKIKKQNISKLEEALSGIATVKRYEEPSDRVVIKFRQENSINNIFIDIQGDEDESNN